MDFLTPQEEKSIFTFKNRVLKEFRDETARFRLFGSRARGEGNEDSDVDILVLVREAPTAVRSRIFEIAADILLEYEVNISPLVMSATQFEDMKRRERLLPREIERDGRPL